MGFFPFLFVIQITQVNKRTQGTFTTTAAGFSQWCVFFAKLSKQALKIDRTGKVSPSGIHLPIIESVAWLVLIYGGQDNG